MEKKHNGHSPAQRRKDVLAHDIKEPQVFEPHNMKNILVQGDLNNITETSDQKPVNKKLLIILFWNKNQGKTKNDEQVSGIEQ